MPRKTKTAANVSAEQPLRAVQIDGYRALLETLRSLHADPKVIETAERVVREREEKVAC